MTNLKGYVVKSKTHDYYVSEIRQSPRRKPYTKEKMLFVVSSKRNAIFTQNKREAELIAELYDGIVEEHTFY